MKSPGVMRIMWIDEELNRHCFEVPRQFLGDLEGSLKFWADSFRGKITSKPRWVFYEMDNREGLFAPVDALGFTNAEVIAMF